MRVPAPTPPAPALHSTALQASYSTAGNVCPSACTSRFPHNITIVSSAYHMHTLGKRIITRRARAGQEALPLAERRFYDFGYQVGQGGDPRVSCGGAWLAGLDV